jgi:hypothetical protein
MVGDRQAGVAIRMQTDKEELLLSTQQALDDLFAQGLIPFALLARGIESLGYGEYIVRFQDERLPSIDVSQPEDQSFDEAVRKAVVDRVSRLDSSVRRAVSRRSTS